MKHGNLVSVLKTSTGIRAGILTLLACGAHACSDVNLDPVGVGGTAGSGSNGGSSSSAGRGGTASNAGNGGSAGTGGTAGDGGSSGTAGGGTGGTSNGTGGTGTELPDGGDPGPVNLITNPGFEQGLTPWTMIAQAGIIQRTTDCNGPTHPDAGVLDAGALDAGQPEPAHGLYCGRGTGRSSAFHGPAYPLNGVLTRGETYTLSAYGRIAKASSSVMKFTMRVICQDAQGIGLPIIYFNLTEALPVTDREWIFMTNQYTVPGTAECPTMSDIRIYVEGPPANVDVLVDDVSIYKL